MKKILQSGSVYTLGQSQATYDKLPQGVYLLKESMGNYWLEKKEDFVLPKKIYGDHSIVDRWLHSYNNNSEKNMGIILSGLKGTGKTITAQMLCIQSQMPIILINAPYTGVGLIDFLTNPAIGNAIIFIDEFEKIYEEEYAQRELLQLMDGNYPTRLLFLLTVNEFNINEYLVNRLNRVKYRKHYVGLTDQEIAEVAEDMLLNKDHVDSLFEFFEIVGMSTFDLLVNIIREMNLFNENALECAKHLNLKIEPRRYDVVAIGEDGRELPVKFQGVVFHSNMDYLTVHINQYQMDPEERKKYPWSRVEIDFEDEGTKVNKLSNTSYEIITTNDYNNEPIHLVLATSDFQEKVMAF